MVGTNLARRKQLETNEATIYGLSQSQSNRQLRIPALQPFHVP